MCITHFKGKSMTEETEEKPSYYAIITADVRYDERLSPSEKLMWGEFTCLTNKYGYSTASNNYFAKLYNKDPSTISKCIKHLEECGYISVEYERNGKQIIRRIIRMTHMGNIEKIHDTIEKTQEGVLKNFQGGIEKTPKVIIQDNNNTSNNITSKKEKPKVEKHKYGEFENVLLTDDEYQKLKYEHPTDADAIINNFSQLKEMKGYVYKSDYLALRNWGIRAFYEQKQRSKPIEKFTEIYQKPAEVKAREDAQLSEIDCPF